MKVTTEFCPPTPSMGSQEHPRDRNNPAETHVGNGRHVGRKRCVEPVRLVEIPQNINWLVISTPLKNMKVS